MPRSSGTSRSFDRAVTPRCRALFSGVGVGVDRLAGRILCRPDYRLPIIAPPLLKVAALYTVKLHLQHACLLPFTIWTIFDVADDRLERALAQVVGKLVLVEAFGGVDRLAEHLKIGVGKGWQVIAERVHSFPRCLRLVFLQKLVDARKLQGLSRLPEIVVDDAVELWPELLLDRGI